VSADADRRYLTGALVLIAGFMVGEVMVGLLARSPALISDAGHMLTDAASIVLALVAMRLSARPPQGGFTHGLKRAEIMSALINGITLLLGAYFVYEGIRRLFEPPEVAGGLVLVTGLVGIAVYRTSCYPTLRARRARSPAASRCRRPPASPRRTARLGPREFPARAPRHPVSVQ
jgi:cobalt-zinc-cadmium efflux system protein